MSTKMCSDMRNLAILASLMTLLGGCAQSSNVPSDEVLIAHVLERRYDDRGFTVVDPETTMSHLVEKSEAPALRREYLRAQLAQAGFAAGPLVDSLFNKNLSPVRLSLKSDPERGYVFDHDGRFRRYFDAVDGRGWERWYEQNPKAHGYTRVSLPAYDQASGLLLIYIGTQEHWLDGAGFLKLYRFKDGTLSEVWSAGVWIS
jgi:hypothetical protein